MLFLISSCESNIGLFSVAPCIVIAFRLLSIIFGISSLLLFFIALSLYITLPTIVISIVVAFSHYFSLSPSRTRKRNIWGAIQKRSHEMYKPIQKNSKDNRSNNLGYCKVERLINVREQLRMDFFYSFVFWFHP